MASAYGLSAVAASAGVGLLGSFAPDLRGYEAAPVIYCGSFAGMCSAEFFQNWLQVAIVSLLGALFFELLRAKFAGFGGKLGMTAFLSVAVFYLFKASF